MRLRIGILGLGIILAAATSQGQTCFYCAVNHGCYPTSTGWYPCWRDSSGRCRLGAICALAGGGECDDPGCFPRPIPLSVAKPAAAPMQQAQVPTAPAIREKKDAKVYGPR